MKCLRHKIHLNLFLSVLTANLDWVVSYGVQVRDRQLCCVTAGLGSLTIVSINTTARAYLATSNLPASISEDISHTTTSLVPAGPQPFKIIIRCNGITNYHRQIMVVSSNYINYIHHLTS